MRKQLFPFALALFMLPAFFLVGYNFGASNQRATTEKAVKAGEEAVKAAEGMKAVAVKWEDLYYRAARQCAP